MSQSIAELAKLLNLSEKALDNRRRKIRMSNPKDVEGQLLAWLKAAYEENRDKPRLLRPTLPRIRFGPEPKPLNAEEIKRAAEESAYTSNPYQSFSDEPEAVDPDEIAQYRHSRQAGARFSGERTDRVGELLGAIEQIKGAVSELDPSIKRKVGRELWTLRSRVDALERKLKREMAA